MDIFLKEQTIESMKAVIKARSIFVLFAGFQVFALKAIAKGVSLTSGIVAISLIAFVYIFNILCWLYISRPVEKINSQRLQFLKVFQIIFDVTAVSIMIYLNGTTNTFTVSFYLIAILGGSILYQKKGILFTTLVVSILYTGLSFLEYFGYFLYQPNPEAVKLFSLKNNWTLTIRQILIFNIYAWAAGVYALFLADVNIKRQKDLEQQRIELMEKTKVLTETELILKDALTKSDKARLELIRIKENLEKTNLELKEKIEELERFHRLTVGREIRMIELKKEIKELKDKIKELEQK